MALITSGGQPPADEFDISSSGVVYRLALPQHATDYIQGKVAYSGAPYEEEMLSSMRERLQPNDLVLDVGANVGNHTVYLAKVARARVIAFEPNSALVDAIKRSVEINDLSGQVVVYPFGVGAAPGRASFEVTDEANLGGQSIAIREGGDIKVVSLDSLDIYGPVAAIKIDVEGMEADVLAGAEDLIRRDRPLIYVECIDLASFNQIVEWARVAGYYYLGSYNATPTHLFGADLGTDGPRQQNEAAIEAVRRTYILEAELRAAQASHREAALKYRELTQAYSRVRNETLPSERQRNAELAERIELLELRESSLELALKRARGEALRYQEERNHQADRARTFRSREAAARAQIARARREVEQSKAKLRRLKGSRAYRLARLLAEARRSWRRAIRLPFDTVRLVLAPGKDAGSTKVALAPGKDAESTKVAQTSTVVKTRDGSPGRGKPKRLTARLASQRVMRPAQLAEQEQAAQRAAARLRSATGAGRRIRIAAIVDDFTRQSLSLECDFLDLRPSSWREELEGFLPDLLFVESAWRGVDGTWHNSVSKVPTELVGILEWCRARAIPTVFWNKEDPVHFETFARAAAHFDHVFTTDLDKIADYRRILGHDRVRYLGFACQPKIQNPIETRQRKHALVFAGGYYRRYQERMRDLEAILEGVDGVIPVEIYDRMLGTTLDEYEFPEKYRNLIVGTLDAGRIERAYKGYRFALNLNSVKSSQTMFARRVYELLSSGTVTISNYAHGLRTIFGDVIPMSDSARGTRDHLEKLVNDPLHYERLRVMGLRKVHAEHTYADRLNYVLAAVADLPFRPRIPEVAVVAQVRSGIEARNVLEAIRRQQGVRVVPVIVTKDQEVRRILLSESVRTIEPEEARSLTMDQVVPGADALAVFSPLDWYGDNYLQDLVQAWLYADVDMVGKSEHFAAGGGSTVAIPGGGQYRYVSDLLPRRSVSRPSALHGWTLGAWLAVEDASTLSALSQFAIHSLDYCDEGLRPGVGVTGELRASLDIDTGVEMADLYAQIEDVARDVVGPLNPRVLRLGVLPSGPFDPDRESVGAGLVKDSYRVVSNLPEGAHKYLWRAERVAVKKIWRLENPQLHVQTSGDLDLRLALRFYDRQGGRVGHQVLTGGRNHTLELPEGATKVEFGVRALGSGTGWIRAVYLETIQDAPDIIRSTKQALVVTDNYPSYSDLYRNGFVHARLRAYARRGVESDVFRLRPHGQFGYHEFEGQEVVTGSAAALRRMLDQGSHTTIMVHFLNSRMWSVLREYQESHRIIVWVHGAEVQPWWRREYNYETPEELEAAKPTSDERLRFWREVLDELGPKTHFVFVSRYFAGEVSEDLEREFPPGQVSIIHNPIDVEIFDYVEKGPEARKKILSIRPFASAKYANDLSVAAVLDLSREPWFSELEFRFVGDGRLFEETVAPLRDFPNVTIEQGFLDQPSIARLHKKYGVFLVPTRMDAQGVSKDEAMASGLVPVTSDVAAIPEFVDGEVGYLAPYDDYRGLADAIREMYYAPDEFLRRSRAAAARTRTQTSANVIVPQELALIVGGDRTTEGGAAGTGPADRAIAILGSCVSRDMFEVFKERIAPPVAYFARSSLASAMCLHPFTGVDTSSIQSAFQRRVVEFDLSGEFRRFAFEGDYDILLIDLVDERFDLVRRGRALATRSNEFLRATVEEEGLEHVPALSEEYFALWEEAWSLFVEEMRRADRLDRVRVNEVYWTQRLLGGGELPPNFSPRKIEANNAFLARMYSRMAEDLEVAQFLRYPPGELVADPNHRWGPAPFHYANSAYEHLVEGLTR